MEQLSELMNLYWQQNCIQIHNRPSSTIQMQTIQIFCIQYWKQRIISSKTKMPKKYGKRKQTPDLHETQLYDKVTKLQSQILSELQSLNKKRNYKFDCAHCYEDISAQYDPSKNYYDEFWKAYLINAICIKRYQDYRDWIRKINRKINNVENVYSQRRKIMQPLDAKRRKKNSQAYSNQFLCKHCGKKYKDRDSLSIHVSIKHTADPLKFQAKIQQLNQPYIQNSDSQQNYYSQDE